MTSPRNRVRLFAVVSVAAAMALSPTFGSYSAFTSNEGNTFGTGTWASIDVTMDDPGAVVTGNVVLTATPSATGGSSIASVTIQHSPAGAGTWTDVCTDTTSPYSCPLDSALLADALYDFRATATSDANDTAASTAVTDRRIDNTAPAPVTMTDPGAWFPRIASLSSTSSDGSGSGVASVRYEYKLSSGSTWATACTGAGTPFSCNFDASTLTEGSNYDFRAVATDGANLSTTSVAVLNRRLDKTLPTATMTNPGANLRGTVTLSASASDTGGSLMQSVRIQRGPDGTGDWTDVCTDSSSPYSCSLNTTTVADGFYDFRAIARDNAGNQTTSTAVVDRRIDNTAPGASIDQPAPYVRGTFTLTGTASDAGSGVGSVQFQYALPGGSSWDTICTDTSVPYTCSVPGGGYNGSLDFRVIATDVAGNQTASSAVTTILDNNDPMVSMGNPGANLRGSVSLAATASDTNIVASVTIQHKPSSGSTWTDACTDTTSPYSCTLDTTTLTDGLYDFRATGTDGAGNTATSSSVTGRRIDNSGPAITMTDPGEWFGAAKTLSSTSSDGGSGMSSVRYRYKLWSDVFWTDACIASIAPYSCDFDPSALTEGAIYDFQAIATDVIGNQTTSAWWTRTVRLDPVAPTDVTMDDPGTPLTGSVTLSGAASDASSGIASLTFQVAPAGSADWASACTAATAPYSCSFDTATLADGTYDFRVLAQDLAGNTTPSEEQTSRMIDNNAPVVTMSDPGGDLRQTVTLAASGSDGNGIGSITIQRSPAGAGTWTDVCTDTGAPFECSLDTLPLPDGLYDFRAIATDGNGRTNTSASVANRRVDNTAPTVSAAIVQKSTGGSGGRIRQGAGYRVYANVSDAGSGIFTATANTSSFDTGVTATTLSPGSWTVNGVAYNRRSAQLTANGTLTNDASYVFTVTATDAAGNNLTPPDYSVTIDNTAPTAIDVQTAGASGGTAGMAELGDTITWTFSEGIDPNSILPGWDGASTAVVVRLDTAASDEVEVWNAANSSITQLGRLTLGRSDYVSTNRTFGLTGTASTMVMSGSTVTVTLGTASGAVTTAAGDGQMRWLIDEDAGDLAGNDMTGGDPFESGAADREF
jgi:hypothetical protein